MDFFHDVPVIMNIANFAKEEVSMVRRKKMADELLSFDFELDAVSEKIEFLQFIKRNIKANAHQIRFEHKRSAIESRTSQVMRAFSMFLS